MNGSKDYGQRDSASHEQVFRRTARNLLNSPPEPAAKQKRPAVRPGAPREGPLEQSHAGEGLAPFTDGVSPGSVREQTPRDHGARAHKSKRVPAGLSRKTA